MDIVVKSQAEFGALPASYETYTRILIQSPADTWVSVNRVIVNAHVEAWESAHVVARGSAHVVAWESAHVVAWESAHVVARGSAHVVAWESAHVEAWGSAHVVARGSAHVEAWGSAHVVARGSAHVVAWGSAHVEAWGSAHVVARGSAHVVARGSAHVEAWGSAHVEARGSVSVTLKSDYGTVLLFAFAVCIALAKGKIEKKSRTCTVIRPKESKGLNGWLDRNAVASTANVVLFKRVSKDLKTQENTKNETLWAIGGMLEIKEPNFEVECGPGKFHACSRAYHCDEFRSVRGDRYIAIEVARKNLHAHDNPQYPYKIAFSKAKVLYECDQYGNKI